MKRIAPWVIALASAACGSSATQVAPSDAGTSQDASSQEANEAGSCGNGTLEGLELCEGAASVECATLTPVWAGGKATCRADCSGYDVSTCTLGTQLVDTVYPANDDPRWANARCNDLTPFAFQVSMATPRTDKWVVYF